MLSEMFNGSSTGNLAGFDASQIEPSVGFEPIPEGTYVAVITDSEMKPTKAGDGKYLELQVQVIEGEFHGRRLWDRLNLENPSELAEKIAQATLSAICRAVGVMEPRDSSMLHNRPLLITVRWKRRNDTGELAHEIRKYAPVTTEQNATVSSKVSSPPWARQ